MKPSKQYGFVFRADGRTKLCECNSRGIWLEPFNLLSKQEKYNTLEEDQAEFVEVDKVEGDKDTLYKLSTICRVQFNKGIAAQLKTESAHSIVQKTMKAIKERL